MNNVNIFSTYILTVLKYSIIILVVLIRRGIMKETKKFKTETKRLLDMMINSIYTHKEIFLRELISNASDAIDKRHYLSLTNNAISADNYEIKVEADKDARTITITDNGVGMTLDELKDHLGTIAKSGSKEFLEAVEKENTPDVDIIGQFGVGFYSAFMVANTHACGKADLARRWRERHPNAVPLMIGDTDHDAETARAMGADIILLFCGHQSRKKLEAADPLMICERPAAIPFEKVFF